MAILTKPRHAFLACAVACLALAGLADASPSVAARATAGSFDGVSSPAGGVPTAVWGGTFVATGTASGGFTPPRVLLPITGSSSVNVAVASSEKQALIAAEPFASSGAAIRSLGVYFGGLDAAGRAHLRRVLPGADGPWAPVIAGSPAGDALLAWNHGEQVAVDRRAPRGLLRPPVVAAPFTLLDAAIDGKGNATVIGYRDSAAVLASSATRGGRFGKVEALPANPSQAHVAAGPNGQTAVVAASSATGLELFYRPRPDAGFGTAQTVAAASIPAIVATAVDAQGRVLVAWTDVDENHRLRLRAMVTDAAGQPTEPSELSAPDRDVSSGHAATAMNADGDAAAAWEESAPPTGSSSAGPPQIYASFRPAGGGFGPAQRVTPPERHAASIAPPAVAVGADGTATLLWADATDPADTDQRFMAAHLTSAGVSAVTRLDVGSPLTGAAPSTPPLLSAGLSSPAVQRVNATSGRFKLRVRCISWTLEPCRGRLAVIRRGRLARIAGRAIKLQPNSSRRVSLHLSHAARRSLAAGRTLRTTARVTLTGPDAAGAHKPLTLRAW